MARAFVFSLLIGCAISANSADSRAEDQAPNPAADAAIAPFVGDQTIVVAVIDLAALRQSTVLKPLIDLADILHPFSNQLRPGIKLVLDEGPHTAYLIVTWSDLLELFGSEKQSQIGIVTPAVLVLPEASKELVSKINKLIAGPTSAKTPPAGEPAAGSWVCREIGPSAVLGDRRLLDRLASQKPTPRPEFAAGFEATRGGSIQIVVAPPASFSRAAKEILRTPTPGANTPLGEYLAGVRSATLAVDLADNHAKAQFSVQTDNAAEASRLAEFLNHLSAEVSPKLYWLLGGVAPIRPDHRVIPLPPSQIDGNRLGWTLDETAPGQFAQWVERSIVTHRARVNSNHFQQIGLALLNYHDVHKYFPDRAIRDADGKPLLSWRVKMLPYMDGAALFNQFHHDEPWDSPHNRKLIDQMPNDFRIVGGVDSGPGRTRLLALVGKDLAFAPDPNMVPEEFKPPAGESGGKNLPAYKRPVPGFPLRAFSDGASKTIIVVEAAPDRAVIWTKPDDLEVDLTDPKQGITDGKADFFALFADGRTVEELKGSIDSKALRAMFTRNAGDTAGKVGP
jgi:Protein of unknown function (DUF1559)